MTKDIHDKFSIDIDESRMNMALTDAYWHLVNAKDSLNGVPVDKILVLVQYLLTSYLSTIPEQRDIQVQVQKLLLELLPADELDHNIFDD